MGQGKEADKEIIPLYVNSRRIAEITGINKDSIYRLAGQGLIPSLVIQKNIRFSVAKVIPCLEERYSTSFDYASREETLNCEENLFVNSWRIAELFSLPESAIRRMARNNEIPGVKINGTWRFNEDKVVKYIEKAFNNSRYSNGNQFALNVDDGRILKNYQGVWSKPRKDDDQ